MPKDTAVPTRVSPELYLEVVQFLFREADLLDRGQFDAWLELLSEDIVYEMPGTLTRDRSEQDGWPNESRLHLRRGDGRRPVEPQIARA